MKKMKENKEKQSKDAQPAGPSARKRLPEIETTPEKDDMGMDI